MPSPEIVQDRNRESVLVEILHLLREQWVLPTVVSNAANRPCAPGGPVLTWAVDGTARTIVPPVGFPTREPQYLPGSPCQWTYAGGPALGKKPETILRETSLRAEAGDPADSPEPE